jgi:PKD repeat protein
MIGLVAAASLIVGSGGARAAQDGTAPPITLPPPAGEVMPPADAIVPSNDPANGDCSGWYHQSTYGAHWTTDATWWEYACDQTGHAGDYWTTDYYYWDGTQSVFYGEWYVESWWDGETYYSCYWFDQAAGDWYGSFSCDQLNPGDPPPPPNVPPTATFTYSCVALTCSFDASGSTDPDGAIMWWDWEFGDNSFLGGRGDPTHTYAHLGTYPVKLTVTDTRYASATYQLNVVVDGPLPPPPPPNNAPTASFTFSCTGVTCSFDAGGSSDRDGTIASYAWYFGDNNGMGTGSPTVQHDYLQAGSYTVTLEVTDNGGAKGSVSKVVTVTNNPPVASFTSSCSTLTCSFDGSASTDSDGTIKSYWWDFGDASYLAVGTTAQHTYAAGGTYTVKLTVIDNGGINATATKTVSVAPPNTPPVSHFTLSCSGATCTFDGSAAADSDGTIATYAWTFGDGSSGSGKTAQHAYAKGGAYAVTLTVTDDRGAAASESKTAAVVVLAAIGSKVKGVQKVDLSWTGPASTTYDVSRNGATIATVQAAAYTDTITKGSGSYSYKVCVTGTSSCSNTATVAF